MLTPTPTAKFHATNDKYQEKKLKKKQQMKKKKKASAPIVELESAEPEKRPRKGEGKASAEGAEVPGSADIPLCTP